MTTPDLLEELVTEFREITSPSYPANAVLFHQLKILKIKQLLEELQQWRKNSISKDDAANEINSLLGSIIQRLMRVEEQNNYEQKVAYAALADMRDNLITFKINLGLSGAKNNE